jgi:polar amino acid transport system substrate-binding protein
VRIANGDPLRRGSLKRAAQLAVHSVAARLHTPRRIVVVTCLASVLMAACGSPTASTGTSTLQQVLSSKVLRVATLASDAPYVSLGPNGQLQGYDIDLANLLAKSLGVKAVFTTTDFPGRVTSVQTGKADVTIADFTPSLARAQVVSFTEPYSVDGINMLTRTQDNIQSFADLNKAGVKIGIPRGVPVAATLPGIFPNAQIVTLAAEGDVVTALATGQVQGIAINTPNIGTLLKTDPGTYKIVGDSLSRDLDSIGLKQGDFGWLVYLNTFIRQINEDGTNLALWNKYIGGPPPYFIQTH